MGGTLRTMSRRACPPTVSLILDFLRGGSVCVLMILLLNSGHYPANAFDARCHRCSRVEEAITRLKHRLRRDVVTGLDYPAPQRHLGGLPAKTIADNLHTLLGEFDVLPRDCPSVVRTGFTRRALKRPSATRAFCELSVASTGSPMLSTSSATHDAASGPCLPIRDRPRKAKPHLNLAYKVA